MTPVLVTAVVVLVLVALVVAGLGAEGETLVSGLEHIRRGYDRLDAALAALGADIRVVRQP